MPTLRRTHSGLQLQSDYQTYLSSCLAPSEPQHDFYSSFMQEESDSLLKHVATFVSSHTDSVCEAGFDSHRSDFIEMRYYTNTN